MSSQCSVCQNPTFKYHCPGCRAPSCSLQCFKTHKSQCDQPQQREAGPGSEVTEPHSTLLPDNAPTTDRLMQDPRLERLFEQYPSLRAKLRFIFETATATATVDDSGGAFNPSSHSKSHRSQGKSFAHAMRILERDMNSNTADAAGIAAFADLVAEMDSRKPQSG